jgi:hypothetical protein
MKARGFILAVSLAVVASQFATIVWGSFTDTVVWGN